MSHTSPLIVVVTSGDETIGTIEPGEFMTYAKSVGAPGGLFLNDYVKQFNQGKADADEPERVHIRLKPQRSKKS